jgi:hypothetical protein
MLVVVSRGELVDVVVDDSWARAGAVHRSTVKSAATTTAHRRGRGTSGI